MKYPVTRRAHALLRRGSFRSRASWIGAMCGICALGLPLLPRSDLAAQEGSDDHEVRDCIALNQIDHTDVVDDDTILFHMRGREIYENDLPNRCPELRSEDRFMYRVSTTRLCDLDTITVLADIGFGFMPGATCGLGKFAPISEDEAADLVKSSSRHRRR